MKKINIIFSFILILSIIVSSAGNNSYAKGKISGNIADNKMILINGKLLNENDFDKAINGSGVIEIDNNSTIHQRGCAGAAVVGAYFVPGVGEVLVATTGVVIICGTIVYAGNVFNKKILKYHSEHTKNARKSTHDKHTKLRPGRETEKKKVKTNWKKRK